MNERTNDDWLTELGGNGVEKEVALTDLRAILIRGLRRGLVNQVNTAGPEFEPLAEDFVQEALLKILANLDTFKGNSKFTTWAHKITVRVALTELRRKRWQDRSLDDLLSDDAPFSFYAPDNKPTPAELTERSDLMARLQRVIDEELTEKQKTAMTLVPIGGVPVSEAADKMNMTRNAFYKLLHDARLRLKKRLEKEGLSAGDFRAAFD